MPELGLRPPPPQGPELGRLIGNAMPDAKMGDFGPMSASLVSAVALSVCLDAERSRATTALSHLPGW